MSIINNLTLSHDLCIRNRLITKRVSLIFKASAEKGCEKYIQLQLYNWYLLCKIQFNPCENTRSFEACHCDTDVVYI